MSSSGLVHNAFLLIFDGTNYDDWRNHMLNSFRVINPNRERILDMGFSPPKDPKRLSLEDEKNSYLDAQASKAIFMALRNAVALSISPYRNAHELWTKLQGNRAPRSPPPLINRGSGAVFHPTYTTPSSHS